MRIFCPAMVASVSFSRCRYVRKRWPSHARRTVDPAMSDPRGRACRLLLDVLYLEIVSLTLFITGNEHVLVAYGATGISVPTGPKTRPDTGRGGLTACLLEREAEQTTPLHERNLTSMPHPARQC